MKINKRIILVTPSQAIHVPVGEHLGIGYLASVLRLKGFNVEIIDGWLESITPQRIVDRILSGDQPLLVGFTSYSSNMLNVIEILSILKLSNMDSPCVVGGYGPTFQPEDFLFSGFNFVVRGEGERVLPRICDYLLTGTPRLHELFSVSYLDEDNVVCHNPSDPEIIDLDTLPFPARDTIPFTIFRKNPVNILTSRGCLGGCAFCSIQTYQNITHIRKWRQRNIMSFVDEIEELVNCYGVSHFKVVDDSFIEPPRDEAWCTILADELEKRNLKVRLRCSIRANRVTDEVVKQLKRAGFFSFACGIENFSPTALKRMNKGAALDHNIHAIEVFNKYKVNVEAGIILFDDSTTLQELNQNYEYMRKYSWLVSKIFTEMYAAQNTPFTKRLKEQNLIIDKTLNYGNHQYQIIDPLAYKVYQSLKIWNVHYQHLYDLSISPLRAVRAINENYLKQFHNLYLELHERELDIFGKILCWVKDNIPNATIEKELNNHYTITYKWYNNFEMRLKKNYLSSGIDYDLHENPFINSVISSK